jgi:probable rRNA maturation factor
MPVAVSRRVRKRTVGTASLKKTAQRLLEAVGCPDALVSVVLVGDAAMRTLNRTYRGKDRTTDVLSFPLDAAPRDASGPRLLGDIIISVDRARRQAASYDATIRREIERLLIHGILHLLGHDHHRHDERARMEREERRLAAAIGMPWPYA